MSATFEIPEYSREYRPPGGFRVQHPGPAWCIAFALSLPTRSASCERVFFLPGQDDAFGEQQMSALADYIRAALMLKFNQRVIG